MADWTPASVVLTGDQKTAAAAEGNSAKRLNLILASIMLNVDAAFTAAGTSVDAKITEAIAAANGVIDQKFVDLKASLGTNFNASDVAGRDALASVNVGDICFVVDDGDGKWAKYEVISVPDGSPTSTGADATWTKLIDQDMLTSVNVDNMFAGIQQSVTDLAAATAATDAANLTEAKAYADTVAAAAAAGGNTAAAQALTDAKAYTDAEVATAKSEAAAATSAAVTAATDANTALETTLRSDLDPSVAANVGSDADWGLV